MSLSKDGFKKSEEGKGCEDGMFLLELSCPNAIFLSE